MHDTANRVRLHAVRARGRGVTLIAAVGLAIAVVAVTAAGSRPAASAARSAPAGWTSWSVGSSGGRLTVRFPSTWQATRFRGVPAPVFFPLFSLTSESHEVQISWALSENPTGEGYRSLAGRSVRIDGRPARLSITPAGSCAGGRGNSSITAAIALVRRPGRDDYEYFQMTAVVGPAAECAAVNRMLDGVRITN
jgi:hypothetical protein